MRRLMRVLLTVVVPALLVTGVSAADAAPEAPMLLPAEVGCNSFTSVNKGAGYYLHVPSVGSGSFNFNCVLARGHINIGVLALQESLNACYQQGLKPDSNFGGNTERAVRNAQIRINEGWDPDVLEVDGRFGPETSFYFRFQLYDHLNGGAHTGMCTLN